MQKMVEVLPDQAALVQRSLSLILARLKQAIETRGQFTLALAGGSTPKPVYEAIAAQSLPWDQIHVFWGDERYVPADHPDSNQRMARLAWLDHVPIPPTNIHPMLTDEPNPIVAAQNHEAMLRSFFQDQGPGIPELDLVLLGMGDDGHTASLFPHTAALQIQADPDHPERTPLVAVGEKSGQPRLTFTAPLINAARCVMFVVAGANKQPALAQIFAADADANAYPARLIQPQGELWWLLDAAAGQNLS